MKIVCYFLLATSCLSAIDSFSTYERAAFYYDHSWQQTSVALDALNRIPFRGDEKVLRSAAVVVESHPTLQDVSHTETLPE